MKEIYKRGGNGLIAPEQIAFDIDGVVADIVTTFIDMAREHYDIHHLRYENLTEFDLERSFDIERRIIYEILNELLERPHELAIEPLPHAVPVLTQLAQEAPLLFVTARDQAQPIHTWLIQRLPEVPAAALRVIATGDPDSKLDYLRDHGITHFVEDRLETCFQLARQGIMPIVYDQPWNRGRHSFTTVYDWQDISRLVWNGKT